MAKCHADLAQSGVDVDSRNARRRDAEGMFREVHAINNEHIETRACLAELLLQREEMTSHERTTAAEAALRLVDYNAVPTWTPEESLTMAYHRVNTLRLAENTEEKTNLCLSILEALSRNPPDASDADAQLVRYTRLKGLLQQGGGEGQKVLTATSVLSPTTADGQGTGIEAVAGVPLTRQDATQAAVARAMEAQERAQAQEKKGTLFNMRRLGAFTESYYWRKKQGGVTVQPSGKTSEEVAKEHEGIQEDIECAKYLDIDPALREAYQIALADVTGRHQGDSEQEKEAQSEEDEEEEDDEAEDEDDDEEEEEEGGEGKKSQRLPRRPLFPKNVGAVIARLMNRQIRGLVGEAGTKEEPDDARFRWNVETLRTVLVKGNLGTGVLWRLAADVLADAAAKEETHNLHCSRLVPILYRIMSNRNGLFSREVVQQARQALIALSFALGDFRHAYGQVRRLIGPGNPSVHTNHFWNVLNVLLLHHQGTIDIRSLFNVFKSHESFPLFLVIGNCFAYRYASGKLSLGPFLKAHQLRPNDPFCVMRIALLYMHLIAPRTIANRQYTALHAISYLDLYSRLRLADLQINTSSEVYYNCGRFYQHLGIGHLAADYYWKVLDLWDSGRIEERHSCHREAAFNLHQILKASGNARGATELLRKYIVV